MQKLKQLKIELPYDPEIPLLGIYPEKTMTRKDTCTLMFTAALFAIAKTWKQPKCPSTEEWIKKMWYIYTMEYYSAIKKKRNTSIFSNMDGPRNYHAKWSQSDKETPASVAITDMWNLKKRTEWTYLQNRHWLTDFEKFMVSKGDSAGGGGMCWGCGMEIL